VFDLAPVIFADGVIPSIDFEQPPEIARIGNNKAIPIENLFLEPPDIFMIILYVYLD
jgi:hypothetical protein